MKDMPAFTTEYGVASLILREIPYNQKAYIKIQYAAVLQDLIKECASFCRAIGAEEVYVSGDAALNCYPIYTELLEMQIQSKLLPETDAVAVALRENQLSYFKTVYNEKMNKIPTAAYLTEREAKKLLEKGSGYIVYQNDRIIGVGIVDSDTIDMLASLGNGKGADVLRALSDRLDTDIVRVVVASTNDKAIALYQRIGFCVSQVLEKWYKII